MPNYDYTCSCCNHKLEVFQKITEDSLKNCPSCHKDTLQRGFGGGLATFRFEGSGFYITDYKQKDTTSSSSCCPCNKTSCKS